MHFDSLNIIPMLLALKEAGVDITLVACNVDSTDDTVAAYLAVHGITVYAWQGMSQAEADYLCDMGGELSLAYLDKTPPVKGALEATMSGLHLLKQHALSFPVFDWNSIPLKDRLENRFHVGNGVWPKL